MRRSTERCAGTSLSRKRITPEEESCFSSIIFQLSSLLEYCKTPVIKKPYIYIYRIILSSTFTLHHSIIQTNERKNKITKQKGTHSSYQVRNSSANFSLTRVGNCEILQNPLLVVSDGNSPTLHMFFDVFPMFV